MADTTGVTPETRYAKSGEVHIAYQVVGDGPVDLVFIPGLFTHVEHQWEEPSFARFLGRLASFSRLILFDARGAGLSDQAPELPPMEDQMDDVLAVLDAAGRRRRRSSDLAGRSDGHALRGLASRADERDRPLRRIRVAGGATVPVGPEPRIDGRLRRQIDEAWGPGVFLPQVAPSRVADEPFRRWWGKYERL